MPEETRELLVIGEDKTFKIEIPVDAKVTFAPFSPPRKDGGFSSDHRSAQGTLRIYRGSKDNIMAVFAGVRGFRDLSLEYSELVVREEGAAIWKSDRDGYKREEKLKREHQWAKGELEAGEPS